MANPFSLPDNNNQDGDLSNFSNHSILAQLNENDENHEIEDENQQEDDPAQSSTEEQNLNNNFVTIEDDETTSNSATSSASSSDSKSAGLQDVWKDTLLSNVTTIPKVLQELFPRDPSKLPALDAAILANIEKYYLYNETRKYYIPLVKDDSHGLSKVRDPNIVKIITGNIPQIQYNVARLLNVLLGKFWKDLTESKSADPFLIIVTELAKEIWTSTVIQQRLLIATHGNLTTKVLKPSDANIFPLGTEHRVFNRTSQKPGGSKSGSSKRGGGRGRGRGRGGNNNNSNNNNNNNNNSSNNNSSNNNNNSNSSNNNNPNNKSK